MCGQTCRCRNEDGPGVECAHQCDSKPKPPSNEQRYFDALKRIAKHYSSAEKVMATAERRYGLDPAEALSMSYDNIQIEAAYAIRGKRRPKV